ncbi:unnamed protein product [Closterium sp. NIES-65]|nr:unnamed protein product [Closterium sp. NIES-65]
MARSALLAFSLALLLVAARAGSPITSSTANEKPDQSSKKDDGLMTEIPAAIAKQAAAGNAEGVTYVDTAQDTFFMADVKKAGYVGQATGPERKVCDPSERGAYATGPESIAWDPSGRGPYVSVSDGRILRRKTDGSDWEEFTYASPHRYRALLPHWYPCCRTGTLAAALVPLLLHRTSAICDSRTAKLALEDKCGRPVGMAFHPTTGDLYFADTYYGLFKVSSSGGQATKLVDVVDGTRMMMCNDLDIDADANVVYFTDSSSPWARRDFLPLLLEGRKDGRFMKYDIGTGKTTVLVNKVAFANGVALSQDKKFVVFCETTYLRCHRYWIRGPKTGKKELFVKLPGYPDNLSLNPRGRFWIALNSRNSLVTALLMRTPIIRGAVLKQQAGYNFAKGTGPLLLACSFVALVALGSLGNAEAGLTKRWSKKFKAARVNLPPAKLFPKTDKKNRLARATKRYEGEMAGPESIAWDPNGKGPYVSFSDGRIMRRTDDDSAWEEFTYASPLRTAAKCNSKKTNPDLETTCGRPLGLAFHPTTGDLYFADGYFGLHKVSAAGGQATKLVSALDSRKFMMTNDLDIDADANVVYFTDGSSRWYRRDFLPLTLEGRKDGRFMKYDIASGVTTVIDEKVAFANGVAISQDKTFVVYCETTYLRCHRYWIRGPKAGKKEVFVNLPGYPDNLSLNPRGRFWIALNSRRSPTATVASQTPFIRETFVENKLGYKIVKATQDQRASGIVVEVDADGKITNLLEDKNGKVVKDARQATGPESLAWDGTGRGPYASVSDGRVVRRSKDNMRWETFAWASPKWSKERCQGSRTTNSSMEPICGRPLGLRFHPVTGDLYFADAYFGLHRVGPGGGKAERLVDVVAGKRMLMTNDLDIDADGKNGVVYFTDGSTRWQRKDFFLATLEGQPDGRFMQYDIATGQTKVLVKGVAFANGVAISRDRTFVVFCETSYMRCHRYFIRGPKMGKAEMFVNLPGYPDNVSLNPRGRFWIAINSRRTPMSEVLARSPYARYRLLNDPVGLQAAYVAAVGLSHGIIVEVDNKGVITDVLEDKLGRNVVAASEVVEKKGKLWIGSLAASLRSKPPPPSQFTTHHLAPHLSFNHAYPSPRLALFPVAAPFHFAPLPAPAAASADQIAGGGGGGSGEGGAEAGGGGEGRKEEVGEWRQWIQQALSSPTFSTFQSLRVPMAYLFPTKLPKL